MDLFLEVSLVGLAVGGVYALIALGYVLVYRATRVVNFAHGNIMMVGAYLFFTFAALLGLPWGIALALTLLAAALLGAGLERGLLRPLLRRQRSEPTAALMATFGLAFALHGMVQIVWTSTDFFLPSIFPDRPIVIAAAHGAMYIPANIGYGALIALAAIGVLLVLLRTTRAGLALRAVASDQVAASSVGINVPATVNLTWAGAAASAALAGVVVGSITTLNPAMGMLGLAVLGVVILGGLDSLAGAIVAGLIVGWLQALAGFYLSGSYRDVVPYVVLLIILLVRPHGLFGTPRVERL